MDRVSLQGLGSRPRDFARLVARAYTTPPPERSANSPVEYWLAQAKATRDRGAKPARGDITVISGFALEREFTACARLLYALRVRLPAEAEYQRREAADPAFAAGMDVKAKEIFERLNAFKLEIMNRTRIHNPEEQIEADGVWNGLRRDLRLEDEAQPDPEGALSIPEHHLEVAADPEIAIKNPENTPSAPGIIPDEPPSPRSYWIDLHPIEDLYSKMGPPGQDSGGFVPVEPPEPLSHWIDLQPIDVYGNSVPEIHPEPSSLFMELHPLDEESTASAPEAPPSPAEVTLELHEFHD
ncbi:hypothetical protein FIBSPDRAFT_867234 [Athelia psychrophila]|uniref:Uncharacterized protein n=1 Tax=Athelia psychrophila TaxID=1759441 RepID=A0A166E7W4_9AGAM|nr:hypothetical protein FIBSPDRAFT_867234 [Fibularhizoctonia sp. CBS 109695]